MQKNGKNPGPARFRKPLVKLHGGVSFTRRSVSRGNKKGREFLCREREREREKARNDDSSMSSLSAFIISRVSLIDEPKFDDSFQASAYYIILFSILYEREIIGDKGGIVRPCRSFFPFLFARASIERGVVELRPVLKSRWYSRCARIEERIVASRCRGKAWGAVACWLARITGGKNQRANWLVDCPRFATISA